MQETFTFTQTPAFRPKQRTSAEVIVVGAGLSGLQAAYDAQKAGLTCLVLEAGESIGGQLPMDNMNTTWFDETQHPRTLGLVSELGTGTIVEELQRRRPGLCRASDISNVSSRMYTVEMYATKLVS